MWFTGMMTEWQAGLTLFQIKHLSKLAAFRYIVFTSDVIATLLVFPLKRILMNFFC